MGLPIDENLLIGRACKSEFNFEKIAKIIPYTVQSRRINRYVLFVFFEKFSKIDC